VALICAGIRRRISFGQKITVQIERDTALPLRFDITGRAPVHDIETAQNIFGRPSLSIKLFIPSLKFPSPVIHKNFSGMIVIACRLRIG